MALRSSAAARGRAPPFNRRCSRQGRRKRWSLAADRAVGREALAGFSAVGFWLRRASAGPTAPRLNGRRHCARSVRRDVSGLAPAPAAAPWLGLARAVAAAADRRPTSWSALARRGSGVSLAVVVVGGVRASAGPFVRGRLSSRAAAELTGDPGARGCRGRATRVRGAPGALNQG